MKVVMTLLVRDEEDILQQNIEFHLNHGVDFFVVTDNLSFDGTREILDAYWRLGVLHYIYEPEDNFAQGVWVTRMARLAISQFGADWVINSNADEFWWAQHAQDLKAVLRHVPVSAPGLRVRRHNFVPRPYTGNMGFLETMIYRQAFSVNGLGRLLPPKVCHRALPDISVGQGNYEVTAGDAKLNVSETSELCIFHFPVRTLAQVTGKIEKGGAAYRRSNLPVEVGAAWRTLYIMYQEEGLDRYFEGQFYDDIRLSRALAEGVLVKDQRLLKYFRDKGLSTESGPSFSRSDK